MDLSNLKPADRSKFSKKRVGRGHGSGTGTQAGRGHKGAKSRSGFKFKRGFEGGQMPLHRRIPKRGFHNPFRTEYAVVNLDDLAERFEDRKSTRLNSSHSQISYAVFCLKKKNTMNNNKNLNHRI